MLYVWPLGHQCFPFYLYVQFVVAHNQSVVDVVDECHVCDDVWPVCYGVVNFGLRSIIWAFPRTSPPCFLLEHGIHDFVLS